MTKEEKLNYKKAYVELNELIKVLPNELRDKIPNTFKENLVANMDKKYTFVFDNGKDIIGQNYMVETKALFVELYEKYLAPEEEKEFWKKYDKICFEMIEQKKKEKYGNNINFNNNTDTDTKYRPIDSNLSVEIKKENVFTKIINFIKKIIS